MKELESIVGSYRQNLLSLNQSIVSQILEYDRKLHRLIFVLYCVLWHQRFKAIVLSTFRRKR